MKFIFKKPYLYVFIVTFLVYFFLLYFLSDFDTTLKLAFQYSETVNWQKLLFSIFISILIGIFISINLCYVIREYFLRKDCKKDGVLAGAGVIGGFAVGICPLCIGGLMPVILGIFGITFSFGILPFQGIEIQIIVLILTAFTTYIFYKRKV